MYKLRQTNSARQANPQNSCAQTAEKSKLNEMENAANSVAYTSVQNADLQAHKAIEMGSVIVTYKVFPEDIVESFDALKKQIDNIKPEFASIEGYGEERGSVWIESASCSTKISRR